jgi:hypothetical protein
MIRSISCPIFLWCLNSVVRSNNYSRISLWNFLRQPRSNWKDRKTIGRRRWNFLCLFRESYAMLRQNVDWASLSRDALNIAHREMQAIIVWLDKRRFLYTCSRNSKTNYLQAVFANVIVACSVPFITSNVRGDNYSATVAFWSRRRSFD